jgi:hypothetical protein
LLQYVLVDSYLFQREDSRYDSESATLYLLHALANLDALYLKYNPNTPPMYQSGISYKLPAQFEMGDNIVADWLAINNAPPHVVSGFEDMKAKVSSEHFRDCGRVLDNGGGDCDNVACWRAAELRRIGIDARPYITNRRRSDGGRTYHVVTYWGVDGTHEDSSLMLGMGYPNKEPERTEEVRKLGERLGDLLKGDYGSTFGYQPTPSQMAMAIRLLEPPPTPRSTTGDGT